MGGNALNFPVTRIKREHIPTTLSCLSAWLLVPKHDLILLGSAGKQESSGDLDIAMDVNVYEPDLIHREMENILGSNRCKFFNGTNIGSYAFPICYDYSEFYIFNHDRDIVQIDIMFVENTKWAEFSYFSAGDKSKYKGAVRAILLSAVATEIQDQGGLILYDNDGSLLARVGFGIDPNKGLKRMFKMRPQRKDGKGFTKTMKSVTPEEIQQAFPLAEFSKDQILIDDPYQVVEMLFGPGTKTTDIETAEQIIEHLRLPEMVNKSQLIYQRAAERCKPLVGKIKIPWEIERFIK